MKAIQITIDEKLLAALDRDAEVRARGRSAVCRRALYEYLKRTRRAAISQAYRKGYESKATRELDGWAGEGVWPQD